MMHGLLTKESVMRIRKSVIALGISLLCFLPVRLLATDKPHVIVVGVNGMEWDFIRPLILRGEVPNLAKLVQRGCIWEITDVIRSELSQGIYDDLHRYP